MWLRCIRSVIARDWNKVSQGTQTPPLYPPPPFSLPLPSPFLFPPYPSLSSFLPPSPFLLPYPSLFLPLPIFLLTLPHLSPYPPLSPTPSFSPYLFSSPLPSLPYPLLSSLTPFLLPLPLVTPPPSLLLSRRSDGCTTQFSHRQE